MLFCFSVLASLKIRSRSRDSLGVCTDLAYFDLNRILRHNDARICRRNFRVEFKDAYISSYKKPYL